MPKAPAARTAPTPPRFTHRPRPGSPAYQCPAPKPRGAAAPKDDSVADPSMSGEAILRPPATQGFGIVISVASSAAEAGLVTSSNERRGDSRIGVIRITRLFVRIDRLS